MNATLNTHSARWHAECRGGVGARGTGHCEARADPPAVGLSAVCGWMPAEETYTLQCGQADYLSDLKLNAC